MVSGKTANKHQEFSHRTTTYICRLIHINPRPINIKATYRVIKSSKFIGPESNDAPHEPVQVRFQNMLTTEHQDETNQGIQ
jgi:hypothetical protein